MTLEGYAESDGFVGGHVVLDFVNTVGGATKARDAERLKDWPDALAWAEASGLFAREDIPGLRSAEAGGSALEDLRLFRETLHGAFSALAAGGAPGPAALRAIESAGLFAQGSARLRRAGGRYAWTVPAELGPPALRHRLALAALDLLTSPDLARLRECGRCSWLFLDTSRGGHRRWCRMETCGNRAKVEVYRKRKQTDAAGMAGVPKRRKADPMTKADLTEGS